MNRLREVAFGLAAFVALAHSGAVVADTMVPSTAIFVLVDLSETWYNKDDENRNATVLEKVRKGIANVVDNVDPPVFISYLAIGSHSLGEEALCEVTYTPKLLGGTQAEVVNTREQLQSFIELCNQRLLVLPSERMTDISGAIHQAADMVEGIGDIRYRLLVILSDMKEERAGGEMLPIHLVGWSVLVPYRVLSEDQKDPSGLQARLDSWRSRLKEAGAAKVQMITDSGLVSQAIGSMVTQ